MKASMVDAASSFTRKGVYHGVKVVAALFLVGLMVYGGGLYSFVLFVPSIAREFHWGRAATTGLVSAFWLSAPLALLGGFAIKHIGTLRLLIAGLVIEATFLGLIAHASTFTSIYFLRAGMGLGKVMVAVTLPYLLSRWFSRNYMFALGVSLSGWSFGGLVLAPVTGELMTLYGWRVTCLVIAVGILAVGLGSVLATQRVRSPRELSLGLDGDPLPSTTGSGSFKAAIADEESAADVPSGSLIELLRLPMFWLLAATTVLLFLAYGVLLTHEAAVVEGAGFTPRMASAVLGTMAGVSGIAALVGGWLLDRYSLRSFGIALHFLFFGGAISLMLVDHVHSAVALVIYALTFGFGMGSCDMYFIAVLRRRFPEISLAYTFSAFYFCEISILVLAGPVAGRIFDITGNYQLALALPVGCIFISSLLSYIVSGPGLVSLTSQPLHGDG